MSALKKTILITGASKGIGFAIAKRLYPIAEKLLLVASSIESFSHIGNIFGEKAIYLGADLSKVNEIEALVEKVKLELNYLGILINNAGKYYPKQFELLKSSDINSQIDINFRSQFLLSKLLLPCLKKTDHSMIINISSMAAKTHLFGESIYSATKAAVTSYSESIRKELNKQGVRVTVIHPWGVNSLKNSDSKDLLRVEDIADLVFFITQAHHNCQIEDVNISSIHQWKGDIPPWIDNKSNEPD